VSEERVIYLVTSGEYSDYSVNAVFSTEEGAKEWIAKCVAAGWEDEYDIEEYALDPGIEEWKRGLTLYNVHMDANGKTSYVTVTRPPASVDQIDGRDELVANVWARDEKHAVEIVSDLRARIIAANGWKKFRVIREDGTTA